MTVAIDTPPTDTRRITEADPDFQQLRAKTERQLTASIRQYVADLRRDGQQGADHAASQFIQRQLTIMRDTYLAAYAEGQKDYWQSVSNTRHATAPMTPRQVAVMRDRLMWYGAASVTKMAREAQSAWHAEQVATLPTRTFADASGADALGQWQDSVGVRLTLQSDLTWGALQDGYVDAGTVDPGSPYAKLWWDLEPGAEHCGDCPDVAAGSPYDPPGSGGNELNQTPGDGRTECGAACKCDLSYGPPSLGATVNWGDFFPPDMPQMQQVAPPPANGQLGRGVAPTAGARGTGGNDEEPQYSRSVLLPQPLPDQATTLTNDQKAALDDFRAATVAWDAVRGDYGAAPGLFASSDDFAEGELHALAPGSWDNLTPEQQQAFVAMFAALVAWDEATRAATGGGSELSEPMDAVIMRLFNPNHDPTNGEFAPSGEGGAGEGAPKSGKGKSTKGSGAKKAAPKANKPKDATVKPKATKAKAETSSTPKEKALPKPKVVKAKPATATTESANAGVTKVMVKGQHSADASVEHGQFVVRSVSHPGMETHVEADTNLGGYRILNQHGETVMEGVNAAGVNSYLHGFAGKTGVFNKGFQEKTPAGPKKTAAQKKAYAWEKQYHDELVPKDGVSNTHEELYAPKPGETMMKYIKPDGSYAIVSQHPNHGGYSLTYEGAKGGTFDNPIFNPTLHEYAKAQSESDVNTFLKAHGITNPYSKAHIAEAMKPTYGLHTSPPTDTNAATDGLTTGKSTQSWWERLKTGDVERAVPLGVGKYKLSNGFTDFTVTASDDGIAIKANSLLVSPWSGGSAKGLSPDEAKSYLAERKLKGPGVDHLVDAAVAEHARYTGIPTAEQQVRIDATNARRAELDARYGEYSQSRARGLIKSAYEQYPGMEMAVYKHLQGGTGTHLSEDAIIKQMKKAYASDGERRDNAREALAKVNEISEWSLLHDPNTTREGTIRLFHGTNGKSGEKTWRQRLESDGPRRGTPFTTDWDIARKFAFKGAAGRLIISAHVPVSAVLNYHKIGSSSYGMGESEYTVGKGRISDYTIVRLSKSKKGGEAE